MNTQTFSKPVITLLLSALLIFTITACSSASANSQIDPTTSNASSPAATAISATSAGQASAISDFAKLNLNTATSQDFLSIPGMVSRMVNEFLEYRPYTSLQQFQREIGKYVSAEQVAVYEKYVYVPISANSSDAITLGQIPGLDETEAAALIAGRPYASNDTFLAKVALYVSADQLVAAESYLSSQ